MAPLFGRTLLAITTASVLAAACDDPAARPTTSEAPVVTARVSGVDPKDFKCESIIAPDALAAVLGGAATATSSAFVPPTGVPAPCSYAIAVPGASAPESWTYDIDCRDGAKKRADALFAQYAADSNDNVREYNKLNAAGAVKPNDAGVISHAPEGAAEVAVGAKGLDHHGQGLIFIDDDAPCFVRVIGPDPARRLDLARLIAKNLTIDNAPRR